MTDKKQEQQEFHLKSEDFHVHNFVADKIIDGIIKAVNDMDLNKDGKKDLGQVVALGAKALPLLGALNEVVDFEQLAHEVADSKWVTDKDKFKETILRLGSLAEQMGSLIPPVKH